MPGTPTVSTNASSSRDPRESEHIRLTCRSAGGNPAPGVTWYRDGAPLEGASAAVVPPPVKFGTASGLLDRRLRRDDNGANFTCSFDNDAGTASTTIRLSVHCTPRPRPTFHFTILVAWRSG